MPVSGCPNLYEKGTYCQNIQGNPGTLAGSAAERGYSADWRKARRRFLAVNPLCAACLKRGVLTPATVVDHILPHRGNPQLFWDESNWQPLCKRCHDKKTGSGL